ncbi:MAG TPA: amidohydrolase family protein [bacterium]|nr:amidohydrolase family protein [bacterium]
MKLADCQALDTLPYFQRDGEGKLILAEGVAERIIDSHAHVGLNYLFARPVDQDREDEEPLTFFPARGNPVDMDVYSAVCFTKENERIAQRETVKQAYTTRGFAATHTAKNLVNEMKRMRVENAVILAVDFPLGALSRTSRHFLAAARKYPQLIPFISVHAYDLFMERKVRALAAAGGKGMKIHPPMQLVRANNRRVMKLLKLCGELKLPCLFHTGASDIAPKFQQDLPAIKHFWEPVERFPEVTFIFGHAGIHYYKEAIELTKKHPNVYLETSGQPPARIREMIDAGIPDRVLFGSDWPYYMVALPLAKVLLATEGLPDVRHKILYGNARGLLDRYGIAAGGPG